MKKQLILFIFLCASILVSCDYNEKKHNETEEKYMNVICICLTNSSTSEIAYNCLYQNGVTEESLSKDNLILDDLINKLNTYCK